MKTIILLVSVLFPAMGFAQSYGVSWYKIAGGGGTSSNGQYSLSGTIGQQDASGAMTNGNFSLTGGFWSLIAVVQGSGVPNLVIVRNGANGVQVLWPDTGSYTLQQNPSVTNASGWTTSGYPVTLLNGTNSITISPPTGSLFFRLHNP